MHKIDRDERRGCAPIPYHLLSGLGMYAFLLSAAKLTYCTTNIFLLFLSPPARVARYLAIPKRKFEFLINSVRLAIFRSLSIPTVSELPPKLTRSRPTPTTICMACLQYPTNAIIGLRNGFHMKWNFFHRQYFIL